MRRLSTAILFSAMALVGLYSLESHACTNVLVTKGASTDGSNMVSYAADSHQLYGALYFTPKGNFKPGTTLRVDEWDTGKYLGDIAQIPNTYTTIGNMNEHSLIITETTFGGRPELEDPNGIIDYGSLIYITLQRAKTAREAIATIAELIETYGYASSGESFSIADANEAWIMEMISKGKYGKGIVWVARRIPDGYVSAHANQARITNIPKNDPTCLYSEDVISFARKEGLFDGDDKDFSFCDTYAPADFGAMRGCEARVWSFFNRHGDEDMSKYIDFARGDNPKNRMPLYVKAKEKLSVKDVADMMRDHYEGTEFDMTKGISAGGHELPYRWRPSSYEVDGVKVHNERAIATQQTGFWFVGQCRSWLPNEVGGVFWFAVDDAGTSPLSPFYTCSNAISEHYAFGNGSMIEYSPTSMFWLQNRIAQFAYLRYNHIGKEVRENIDRHELSMMDMVAQADAEAMKMASTSDREDYLTNFSVHQANQLFVKWKTLDEYLLEKYIDGNIKRQNEDGSFKNNGHVCFCFACVIVETEVFKCLVAYSEHVAELFCLLCLVKLHNTGAGNAADKACVFTF